MSNIGSLGVIRDATDEDIARIHSWLIEQDKNDIHGSFLCNWNVINKSHLEGNVVAFIDDKTHQPVGYLIKNFSILEVKESERGNGIGRKLVEHGIELASDLEMNFIDVQCAPATSIPFWEHMGFEMYSSDRAIKELEKQNEIKEGSTPVSVEVSFFPECKGWKKETKPVKVFKPVAQKSPDGVIDLQTRVSIFTLLPVWNYDPVVRIVLDDNLLYEGKAKHEEAYRLGVTRDDDSFYIDSLTIGSRGTCLRGACFVL